MAHGSPEMVMIPGTLVLQPAILPSGLRRGLNSQPMHLCVGQTVKTVQRQEAGSPESSQGPGSRIPGTGRKEYPVGNYVGPTCLSLHTNGGQARARARPKQEGEVGISLVCNLSREQESWREVTLESWMTLSTTLGFGDYLWISFICVFPLFCCR